MPSEDVTLDTSSSGEVGVAVSRFWSERGAGRAVSVDEVLETLGDVKDYQSTRATVIRVLAGQAAAVSGATEISADDRATVASVVGTASERLSSHGPLPTIEGYDLVACLGAGGMGAVFEGYQRATGRRVAVKFMLDAAAMNAAARQRFEREVEVVARLEHPGIVSVIDSGVRRGKYYYVMEFVTGRMLDKALEPGRCDPREALRMVAGVCDAVDYAHQRGVLHRDLKPSNVIVDGDGRPRLLDFGLAKVFDPAGGDGGSHGQMGLTVSGPGHLLGTLAYMSPEQARGRHDETSVRTDVYALGAIAYELVAGRLPCPMAPTITETLASITETDPPAPSSVRKGLGRDLDAVLLKALEKDPDKRYATAGELAADVRRILAREPVTARRVGAAGRAWRWVQRNRAVSTVAAAGLAAVVAVSAVLLRGIVLERDDARYSLGVLIGALEATDPVGGKEPTVVELLDGAAKKINDRPPDRRLTEARLRATLGATYRKLGAYDRSRAELTRALGMFQDADPGDNEFVASALHELGALVWWEGKYDEAEAFYRRALDMKRRLHPGDHPSTADTMTHLAACRLRRGDRAAARILYDDVLEMRRRLHGPESVEVAAAINNVARWEFEGERYDRAEPLFRDALAMVTRLRGDDHGGTAAASQNLGDCLVRLAAASVATGDEPAAARAAAHAVTAFQRAQRIRARMYPRGHHLLAATLAGLAKAEALAGSPEDAARDADAALGMFRATRPAGHPDIADGLEAVALAHLAGGHPADAAAALDEAVRIAAAKRPEPELQLIGLRTLLGRSLTAAGRAGDAVPVLTTALDAARRLRARGSPTILAAAKALAEAHEARGDAPAAAAVRASLDAPGPN